ncbi:MAG: sigma-70 family RNA polymerase sigma factor [Bacteroidota bacterium]
MSIGTSILTAGLSQAELIDGCLSGNRSCQAALYKYFSPKMFGICLRYSKDYHNAEDILQEGFVKVFNNIDKYRGDGSFEGWIKRIFINTAIEHYRKSANHKGHAELENASFQQVSATAIQNLATQDLLKLIQKLSPGYKMVFNLYVIEGFSHKEIAGKLGISEGTSKSQLARARVILQKMVNDLGK